MKKIVSLTLCAVMLLSSMMFATSCNKKNGGGGSDSYEVDLTIDVTQNRPTLKVSEQRIFCLSVP